jgi:16S rRNA (guanine(966)-N(2))-methyltransferase RsmD
MTLRIISGRLGGRRLRAVPGTATRPTGDRVREALFAVLGDRVEGARVLDLFAGTGALAIEALSRGADSAVLVEQAAPAAAVIRANLEDLFARLTEEPRP